MSNPYVLYPVIFFVMSGLFLALAIGYANWAGKKRRRCSASAIATVVNAWEGMDSYLLDGSHNKMLCWKITLKFEAGNSSIQVTPEPKAGKNPYKIGDKVEICYNPLRPTDCLPVYLHAERAWIIFAAFAGAFFLLALLLLIFILP